MSSHVSSHRTLDSRHVRYVANGVPTQLHNRYYASMFACIRPALLLDDWCVMPGHMHPWLALGDIA